MALEVPTRPPISPETMLPDLFEQYPQTRRIFDQYGLHGCGGLHGPVETIAFFCRSHVVELDELMRQIDEAIHTRPAATTEETGDVVMDPPDLADTIYRPFFTAGIATVLTVGASWGLWLLIRIGLAGSFTTGPSALEINAHGHAQIFGWVGLFIMGFAYQAFPRMWHSTLAGPRWAAAAFWMMAAGLVVRSISMALASVWSLAVPVTVASGLVEIAAIVIFVSQILLTRHRSRARIEPYLGFAIAGLGFFLLQAVFGLWHSYHTMSALSRDDLLWYVATYQAPLRDLQIHGMALLMILGVSIRMLPALFEVPAVPARRAWRALGILLAGVLLEVSIFIAYRWTDSHVLAAGLLVPWLLLAVGVGMVALPWRLWRPLPVWDRSAKFVRAAYGWLALSLSLLLLLPVYQAISGIPFSHAYYGAIRHAITVGFISLMIMGVAAKVVPTLNGVDPNSLNRLLGPFLLVNVGCFLRVSTQIATDWTHAAYAVIGLSGALEVTGLAWWGGGLIRIMRQGKREMAALVAAQAGLRPIPAQEDAAPVPGASRPDRIEDHHRVADVLDWFPRTEEIFLRHGFTPLKNRLLRRTLARRVTLRQAARLHGVSIEGLLTELNQAAENGQAR